MQSLDDADRLARIEVFDSPGMQRLTTATTFSAYDVVPVLTLRFEFQPTATPARV